MLEFGMKIIIFIFSFFLWATCAGVSTAATFYVSTNGSYLASGTSLDPFLVIQDALDAAATNDIVLVRPGTYKGVGNSNLRFYGKDIALTSESGAFFTTIDCDSLGHAIILEAGDSTNTVIEGFTITGANRTPLSQTTNENYVTTAYATSGSAVVCYPDAGASFRSCRFVDNKAGTNMFSLIEYDGSQTTTLESFDGNGGAILNHGGTVIITNCYFGGNQAGLNGGAVCGYSNASFQIFDSHFESNSTVSKLIFSNIEFDGDVTTEIHIIDSGSFGGAIYLTASIARIDGCLFTHNTSGSGGAISAHNGSQITLAGSRLSENTSIMNTSSNSGGGGIYMDNGEAVISNTTIDKNQSGVLKTKLTALIIDGDQTVHILTTVGQVTGGGIFSTGQSQLSISNSILRYNTAVAGGGALSISDPAQLDIADCLFVENRLIGIHEDAGMGGGGAVLIRNGQSNIVFKNCRFVKNEAISGSYTDVHLLIVDGFSQTEISTFNRSGSDGGALCLRNSHDVILDGVEVTANAASRGSGIYADTCENIYITGIHAASNTALATIDLSEFKGVDMGVSNVVTWSSAYGGAGGTIQAINSTLTISGGCFRVNHGGFGSAVGLEYCTAQLSSLLLIDNDAGFQKEIYSLRKFSGQLLRPDTVIASNYYTKGLAIDGGQGDLSHMTVMYSGGFFTNAVVTMVNSIVWSTDWEIDMSAIFTSSYSCVLGTTPGSGNLLVDPNVSRHGRLLTNSPCIDAAVFNPAYFRDFEGESITGAGADIGADEFVDTDNDGLADKWELLYYPALTTINGKSDLDVDHASALLEYQHGSNPKLFSTNGELIPDGWLIRFGMDPLMQLQGTDLDNDSFVTLDEYITETDPLDDTSFLSMEFISRSPSGYPSISWYGASNRWYLVQENHVFNDAWTTVTNFVPGNGMMITLSDMTDTNSPPETANYRIQARLYP